MKEELITQNRMIDLSRQSYEKGIYTFSDFLTLSEQSDLIEANNSGKLYSKYSLYGGCENAERVMACFGDEQEMGYDRTWPIICIAIEPLNEKFAEDLSHRDVLGSLMNLGIDRSLLGDIILNKDHGSTIIYVFAKEHIADTLCHELTRIRHTSVNAKVIDDFDGKITINLEEKILQVKSERIDLIISHLYNLSRSASYELFMQKKVFINGRLVENESMNLKEGDIVSVRGYGRFAYKGVSGKTKKGNLNISLQKYV